MQHDPSKFLFIINSGSGNKQIDWEKEIRTFFEPLPYTIELFDLPNPCQPQLIKEKIVQSKAGKVVAVGGDGTLKLVADSLPDPSIAVGILPAGSANGMATELGIAADPASALDSLVNGVVKKIHLTKVNDENCIHLSDIGFNAYVVKKFEAANTRGMWGYVKAAWKVLWQHPRIEVTLQIDDKKVVRSAAMVVIANATQYGNGVVINPQGSLYDRLFEVVIIRKVSFTEIFKMRFTQRNFNPEKTEFFQTSSLHLQSKHKMHFQVDGEYLGKIREVKAEIIPDALHVIVPTADTTASAN